MGRLETSLIRQQKKKTKTVAKYSFYTSFLIFKDAVSDAGSDIPDV